MDIKIYRYTLPLIHPLRIGGRMLTERKGLLFRFTYDDGRIVWSEATHLPGYSQESLETIEVSAREIVGHFPSNPALAKRSAPAALVVMATQGLFAGHAARNLTQADRRRKMKVTFCALLAGNEAEILERASLASSRNYRCVKLKIQGMAVDSAIRITRSVRRQFGPESYIRVDANRSLSFEEALAYARGALQPEEGMAQVQFMEEPLREPKKLCGLRKIIGIPYAVDETARECAARLEPLRCRNSVAEKDHDLIKDALRRKEDPLLEIVFNASYVVLKPSLDVYPVHSPETPAVISAAFESGVGMGMLGWHHMAHEYAVPFCGLDTYSYLAEDVLKERLPMDRPWCELKQWLHMAQQVDESKLELIGDV